MGFEAIGTSVGEPQGWAIIVSDWDSDVSYEYAKCVLLTYMMGVFLRLSFDLSRWPNGLCQWQRANTLFGGGSELWWVWWLVKGGGYGEWWVWCLVRVVGMVTGEGGGYGEWWGWWVWWLVKGGGYGDWWWWLVWRLGRVVGMVTSGDGDCWV